MSLSVQPLEWIGKHVRIHLIDGDSCTGRLLDVGMTRDGEPLYLLRDAETIIPWHAVLMMYEVSS